jgi:hypothetical protein
MIMSQRAHVNNCDSKFIHPELSPGELFFTNSDATGFEAMQFKTKRKGDQAYDGEGNMLLAADWFPVFLHQVELSHPAVSLADIRKEFRSKRSN